MDAANKLIQIAENETKLVEYNENLEICLNGGNVDAKSWYDEFWDDYQNYGNRTDYSYAFSGVGWSGERLKEIKYPMTPTDATRMFGKCGTIDRLPDIDFSKNTNFMATFTEANIKSLGIIDTTNASTLNSTFYYCKAESIDEFILKSDGSQTFSNAFYAAIPLVEIKITGVIGQNGVNFQWSKSLSKASITSIVNALSSTTSGLTITLSKTAVDNAFTTEEWDALINTKTNWTISLI